MRISPSSRTVRSNKFGEQMKKIASVFYAHAQNGTPEHVLDFAAKWVECMVDNRLCCKVTRIAGVDVVELDLKMLLPVLERKITEFSKMREKLKEGT